MLVSLREVIQASRLVSILTVCLVILVHMSLWSDAFVFLFELFQSRLYLLKLLKKITTVVTFENRLLYLLTLEDFRVACFTNDIGVIAVFAVHEFF